MFTANEARILAGETVEEKVEKITVAIQALAAAHHRQLRTGWDYFDDKDLWIDGGYSSTPEWERARDILEDLGYRVTFYYRDTKFVDMYTLIEW